ncbi:mitogen-activated protein kinase kinase kinase 3-like isoform X1 [Alosa sapidissima]|uniref:mitogen-activated protein kinase kinase kinase 3-like isoform X1 n=1 Tax=Alosa sapidissima TaxID=34773 RepID=UPI001C09DFD7|nr:mitogen-activated protein kinase kinase kinase 3-like isoform X1 [Alosa sapidissima]
MDRVREYDNLKQQLENGELTQKGFDTRVKKLLVAKETGQSEGSSSSSNDYLTAAEAFAKAKHLVQPQVVKKKQYPLAVKPSKSSLLKVKMAPMEWRPRTTKRSGKYQKIILEEIPPRVVLQGDETYDDLLKIGQEMFWPDKHDQSEFTLCHGDGSRWTKVEFSAEFKIVSDMTTPWKRTLYVGRRELDNLEVICVDDETTAPDEEDEGDMDQSMFDEDSSAESARGSSAGTAVAQHISNLRVNSESTAEAAVGENWTSESAVEGNESVKASHDPILPSLYLPRVPYVDSSLIKYDERLLLGEGTFGQVYGGSYQGTPAAVKRIVLGSAKAEEQDIHHEINVSLRLSHPNIVRLLAAARSDTCFLLATEYIHGAPLDVVINSDSCIVKLEGHDDEFIALDLAMATEYIHAQQVIHQDLKPANVMIQLQSKRAVLTDWGLANIRDTVQLRQGSRAQGQAVGPMGGTFLYMAPECILHFQDASWYTDMWSLGATYLELFTRSSPWLIRKQRELAALMASKTPPHALQSLNEKYHFLGTLLNYEPQSRPNASGVVEFLKSGLGLDLESRYGYKW